jgi:C_GCAxxG_C_C family probable redox protein
MSRKEQAVELFEEGYSCSQAVLLAYADEVGLPREQACRLSAGFSGGMGVAHTCGVVSAACMVIGLKLGPECGRDMKERAVTRDAVRAFIAAFREKHESVVCKELLGCDISSRDGLAEAKKKGILRTVCSALVSDAIEVLEQVLPK